jgi:hypothetical protein
MLVSFEKNTTIIAEGNTATTLYTAPHPMSGMNYGALTLNIQSIIDQCTGTPAISVSGQGSNDGEKFEGVGTLDLGSQTTTGLKTAAGDFPYAFIRFAVILTPNGSAPELAFMTFDLRANLTRR